MAYLKFSSVSLYKASFPRKIIFSKIFIFWTFYMYGLSQIFVRFALQGFVSEKNDFFFFSKKSKILIFLTFYMYGLPQISVRFALRGLVSEINEVEPMLNRPTYSLLNQCSTYGMLYLHIICLLPVIV